MTSDALLAATAGALDAAFKDGRRRDLNEANTRTFVIEPILSALGYNTLDRLSQEVYLPGAGESVDYVLTAGDRQVFVEAKALSVSLGAKEAIQLVRYCSHQPVRWAILTNGLDWHIFDTDVSGGWEAKRVARIDLAAARREGRLADALRPLALFAHGAVGESDADLSAWSQRERARSHLTELLGDPGSSAVKVIVSSMRKQGLRVRPAEVVELLRDRGAAPPAATSPRPVAEEPASYEASTSTATATPPRPAPTRRRRHRPEPDTGVSFYLFPAGKHGGFSGRDHLNEWLPAGMWGVRGPSRRRRDIKSGDHCCFYATGVGIVATAEITGRADQEVPRDRFPGPGVWNPDIYAVPIRNLRWFPEPIEITRDIRGRLNAFQGRDLNQPWSWFVQTTFRLKERDFNLLTGRA